MPKRSDTKITEQTIRVKPGAKPFEIRDKELRGFILRVQPTGTKTFYCEWARGKRSRIGDAALMTVKRARTIAEERISNAKRGEVPLPQIRHRISTLREFISDKYKDWAIAHQKSGESNVQRIIGAFPDMLDCQIDQLTNWQFEQWKLARKKAGIKPGTINRDLTMVRAALNCAVDWGVVETTPMAGVKRVKVDDDKRVRYLSCSERSKLMLALDAREKRLQKLPKSKRSKWVHQFEDGPFADYLKPMTLLSMQTGLRLTELTTLRWSSVSFENNPHLTVKSAHSKSGKSRYVPLNADALIVLKNWKTLNEGADSYVFGLKSGGRLKSVKRAWNEVLEHAGIHNFRWHDLRHHFASMLVMAGVDLNTVRELLGHRSLEMTLRYAHLAPEDLSRAVRVLEE